VRRVTRDDVAHLRLADEEPAVDPRPVAARLLLEAEHPALLHVQRAEAPRRLHGGHRRQDPLGAVALDHRTDVHVADAVAVGQAERLVADERQHALEPPPGHRRLARVDERHAPRLGGRAVDLHLPAAHVERDVRGVQRVVGEPLLDDVSLVAETDDELLDPVGRVDLHDVPQHRLAADLDHGLGLDGGLLAQP
jgi:hypothetical protein